LNETNSWCQGKFHVRLEISKSYNEFMQSKILYAANLADIQHINWPI